MQGNEAAQVQFGVGGEHWWQIPVGAAIVTSDGISAGTVQELGTAYLRARAMLDASRPDALSDLYLPLQAIGGFDARANVVYLNTPWEGVRRMTTASPANDPLSLQASQYGAVSTPPVNPPVTLFELAIPLREQVLVVTPLPVVTKEVVVRKDVATGVVTTTEIVRREVASVERDDADAPTTPLSL